MDFARLIERVAAAHRRVDELISGLDDHAMRAPSRLPGWTRGHVLAHLADNARGFERQARAALRGELVEMYDGGQAGRDRSIEEGARRSASELQAYVRQSARSLEGAWSQFEPDDWDRRVTWRNTTVGVTVFARWREAEIHATDLGLGYTAHDWSLDFALHALDFLTGRVRDGEAIVVDAADAGVHRTLGAGPDPVTVTGDLRDVVAWMAGRTDGEGLGSSLPELGPWPTLGPHQAADRAAIAELIRVFFAAFVSGDPAPRIAALRKVLLPQAVIVKTGGEPAVYDVDAFLRPRQELLAGGRLTDFREWPLTGRTEVFGDIAQHFGGYAKAGVQDGVPFEARGMKTLQFVRTPAGWRISAVAWDDERPGAILDPAWSAPAQP